MSQARPSIFLASLRTLCVTFFGTIGVGIALIVVLIMLGAAFGGNAGMTPNTREHILPDASGVRTPLGFSGPVVLQVNIAGIIGTEELTKTKVEQIFTESRERALKDDRVKAVLLNINSPGGTSIDSRAIYETVQEYKARYNVPVVAYVDGLCASGSLMIACAADKIVASKGSIVGSVGVILASPFFNISKILDKWEIETITVKAGKGKDMLSPVRPWTEDEAKPLTRVIDHSYQEFVDLVTTTRPGVNREKLINEYGAHIFPADESVEIGFIDGVDYSRSDALNLVAQMANIQDEEYRVVQLETKSWVADVFRSESSLLTGKVEHRLNIAPHLHPDLVGQTLYMYVPGES